MSELVLNKEGVREMLKSAEVQGACMQLAQGIQQRCGDGYATQARNYPERSGAIVKTNSAKARRENAKNNTILKAVGK